MPEVASFLLHGQRIRLRCPDPRWAAAVDEILGPYRAAAAGGDALEIALEAGSTGAPSGLEERGRFEDLVFWAEAGTDRLWIDVHGRGWVGVEPDAGRARARLELDPVEDGWIIAHHAFYPTLLELLKARGLFPVHAGLVARDGAGLLVCGASGSGKTTLCLALAARGWSLLADDTCFLRPGPGQVEGLAFWEDLHVTEETIARFPRLSFLRDQAPRRANWKKHFGVDQLEGLVLAERCVPRRILFPRVARRGGTALDRLSGAEALLRLTPQSVVPAQRALLGRHMDLLGAVVRQAPAWSVQMSDDLDEVVDVVAGREASP